MSNKNKKKFDEDLSDINSEDEGIVQIKKNIIKKKNKKNKEEFDDSDNEKNIISKKKRKNKIKRYKIK